MIKDPYKVLGISENADKDEIKKAYRALAKKYHPDLHPDDPAAAEKMNEINQAYDLLNDPEKLRQYKDFRQYGPGGSDRMYRQPGSGQTVYGQNGRVYDDPWQMFEDMLKGAGYSSGSYRWTYRSGFGSESGRYTGGQSRDSQNRGSQDSGYPGGNYSDRDSDSRNRQRRRQRLPGFIRFLLFWFGLQLLLRSCSARIYYGPYEYRQQPPVQQYDEPYGNSHNSNNNKGI